MIDGHAQANGTLTWEAKQAEALILEVLRLDPQNALALHLYIHLVEATNPLRSVRLRPRHCMQLCLVCFRSAGWPGALIIVVCI